jgi:hypothetical protein
MAVALPFALLIWGIRRVAYVYTIPFGGVHLQRSLCAALLGSMELLRSWNYLSAASFFACIGFAAIFAAVPGWLSRCARFPNLVNRRPLLWQRHPASGGNTGILGNGWSSPVS